MKKLMLCGLCLLLLLFAAGLAQAEATTTVLVYMCGTDLQSDACDDIIEMAEIDGGSAINLVVLAGGASSWDLEDLEGNTRTLAVIRDGEWESLDDWGRASMGSADSLKEFLVYGLQNWPADRTVVILWDHGAGSMGGICFDETANDDSLTVVEIDKVLTAVASEVPGAHIDIFGCDACMMATYEMAAMLSRHSIDYFVASEELEPGAGWDYTGWLDALDRDPSLSDEDLCGAIVESFMETGLADDPDDYLTLSVTDLSKIGALQESMERFAQVMTAQAESNFSAVRRSRSRLYTFGSFDDGSWDMVDLGAALDAYASFDPDNAAEARRLLADAVVLSSQTDNLDPCSGLSILLPQDTTGEYSTYADGFNLTAVIPNWVDFLNTYVAKLAGGSYTVPSYAATVITDEMDFSDYSFYSSSTCYSGSCWTWDDEDYSYSETEVEAGEISVSDAAAGFTAVLPQEALENLDYVEGMLLMDISDDETECYIDLGSMQNNLVDWRTGTVVSQFDGTWPALDGQLVALYDQTSNDHSRRSLIPVKLNGEYTYLVVVFPSGSTEGRIVGANAGYNDSGLPIREMTRLNPGDQIIPVYTLYMADANSDEELQESEFEGDPITWREGMTVTYEDLADEEEPTTMVFSFIFYDIFGEDTMSEIVAFEI